MGSGSWLFPDGVDRERMLEMDKQLQPVRRAVLGVVGITLLASGPWLGWWTVAPLVVIAIGFRLAESRVERLTRPEYALFAAWAASQLTIAVSVALTGGPDVATMSWFAIPVLTLGARFSERGIAVGVALSFALMLAVAFGIDAQAVVDSPPRLLAPAALVLSVAMFQTVLMRSDVKYRASTSSTASAGTSSWPCSPGRSSIVPFRWRSSSARRSPQARARRPEGFGVAASKAGTRFDYRAAFAEADTLLTRPSGPAAIASARRPRTSPTRPRSVFRGGS